MQLFRNEAWKQPRKSLLQGLISFADYLIFIGLIMYKVLLFERYTGISYKKRGLIEYIGAGLSDLFRHGSLGSLQEGIFMVSLGSVLLLSFWTIFLSRRGRVISLIVLNLIVTFVIISDLIYYRYFNDLISVPLLLQAFQVEAIGGSIGNLFQWKDIWFFIDLLLLIPISLYYLFKISRHNPSQVNWRVRLSAGLLVFFMGFVFVASPVKAASSGWGRGVLEINWWNIAVYNITGLIGFHGHDFYRNIKDYVAAGRQVSEEDVQDAWQWFAEQQKVQAEKSAFFGAAKGKNVIMIQGEALQSVVVGRTINGQEVTPNLNKLIEDSMYFDNFYHQIGQGGTSDAEFLAFSSLYPLPTGSAFIRFANNEYDGLPEILKENGYSTGAFHAYKPSFWNRYTAFRNLGFERFYSKDDFEVDEQIGWSTSDESFFNQSVEKVKGMKKPFFSFLITLSSHHPFDIPQNYKELKLGQYEDTDFGRYLHSMHYLDRSIGKMVETLKKEGLWEDTVFIVYGDHDSKVPDNGGFDGLMGKKLSFVETEIVKNQIPLIIHLPQGQGAGIYSQVSGQIDLAPTITDLLGISIKDRYMMGTGIFNEDKRLVVFRNGSFTDGEFYYIPSSDRVYEHGKLYNIDTNKEQGTKLAEQGYNEALRQLRVSDAVIFGNLIKKFRKEQ